MRGIRGGVRVKGGVRVRGRVRGGVKVSLIVVFRYWQGLMMRYDVAV